MARYNWQRHRGNTTIQDPVLRLSSIPENSAWVKVTSNLNNEISNTLNHLDNFNETLQERVGRLEADNMNLNLMVHTLITRLDRVEAQLRT